MKQKFLLAFVLLIFVASFASVIAQRNSALDEIVNFLKDFENKGVSQTVKDILESMKKFKDKVIPE